MGRFKYVKKGDTPTLLDTDTVNKLYFFLNAIEDLTTSPVGMAKLNIGDKNAVLDLGPLIQLLTNGLNAQLQSIAAAGMISTVDVTARSTVNGIIAALNAATITCNPDGTATLTIPNIPNPL